MDDINTRPQGMIKILLLLLAVSVSFSYCPFSCAECSRASSRLLLSFSLPRRKTSEQEDEGTELETCN